MGSRVALTLVLGVAFAGVLGRGMPAAAAIETAEAEVSGSGRLTPTDFIGGYDLDEATVTSNLGVQARGWIQATGFFSSSEVRGVVEFGLPAIPAGATFNSATLLVPFGIVGSNSNLPSFTFHVYGYAGNGALDDADFFEKSTFVGNYTVTADTSAGTPPWPINPQDLSLDVSPLVMTLLSAGEQYAGFLIAPSEVPAGQFSIPTVTVDFTDAGSADPPTLSIDYTPLQQPPNGAIPEPSSVMAWSLLGFIALLAGRRTDSGQ